MSGVFPAITDEWFAKEGMSREPQVWEDGSRVDNLPGRFEWWYFDAHLDDGTTVVAVLYTKPTGNIGIPCSPQIKLIIRDPSGKSRMHVDNLPGSAFSAATDTCDVKAGRNWVRGNLQTYDIHFEVGGDSADLHFVRTVPSWRPGVGKCYFGEDLHDYLGWIVAVPSGVVTGKIAYDGQEHEVRGTGYHDHNFGNIRLSKILGHWYWGRLSIADYNCIFFQFVSAPKYGSVKLPLFMFAKGDQILIQDGSKLAVTEANFIAHPSGKSYPRDLGFLWREGKESISIALSNPTLLESRYLLAEQPWYRRLVARMTINPYYFRFNADLELRIRKDGAEEVRKDKAIFESMMLR